MTIGITIPQWTINTFKTHNKWLDGVYEIFDFIYHKILPNGLDGRQMVKWRFNAIMLLILMINSDFI